MSNNCCTFAPEIGKVLKKTTAGQTYRATQGCAPRGIAGSKTHTASARKKREDSLPISGALSFRYL